MRPSEMNAQELLEGLNRKQLSTEEVVKDHLAQVDRWEPSLGAVLTRCDETALAHARDIDKRRSRGEPVGVLAGIPIGIKDGISTRGIRTTCGSAILKDYTAPYDATVMERLRQADAITLCKLNMDEFAMGSSNENSAFFPCKNPWKQDRVPGGSSGGSAAAVAAGIVPLALGSDTGGSIRQPASFCGVVGMKPTYGRVSRYGLIAYASSLDQIGPMARNILDCAMLLQVIAGYDPRDATSTPRGVPGYLRALDDVSKGPAGKTIGLPKEYFVADGISTEVVEKVQAAIKVLEGLGAKVKEISLPHTRYALSTYYLIATAEASSNLSRFDGVRFGHRAKKTENLLEMYEKSRAEGFGAEVKRRIMLGTYALSAGYYDAYYKKAQEVRTLVRRDFEEAFREVDLIATPTAPSTAFRLGDKTADPLSMYLADIFTIPCNLAGLPGLSLPCGSDAEQLPIGLQLLGKHFDEESLLSVGAAYERAAGMPDRIAPLALPHNSSEHTAQEGA